MSALFQFFLFLLTLNNLPCWAWAACARSSIW